MKPTTTIPSSTAQPGRHGRWFNLPKTVAAAVLAAASVASPGFAANKYWGGPSGTASSPVSGTWDTSSLNWATTFGGASSAAFASGDSAIFGGIDGIAINCTSLTAGSITVSNVYTLQAASAATIGMPAAASMNVSGGTTAILGTNMTIQGTGNQFLFNGNANAYSGTLIVSNGASFAQNNNSSFQIGGGPGSAIRVLTGGFLGYNGTAGGSFRMGNASGSAVLISVEGGTLNVPSPASLVVGNTGGSAATLSMSAGTINATAGLVLGSASPAAGTNNLNGGTLNTTAVSKGNSGGTAVFNFNGGTLKATAASTSFFTGLNAAVVRNGASTINNGGFNITVGQALLHSTYSGDNATDGGLTFAGAAITTANGANTYNGPTIIAAGTLATTTASTGGGSYSISNGAALNLQVASPGATLAGSSLTLGTVNSDLLTNIFALGANASTATPAITLSGALVLNGTVAVNVTATGLAGPNTYPLISYGSFSGSGSFVAGTLPVVSGYLVSLVNDTTAKQLKLVYSQAPQPVKWAVGNGNWDTTTPNWQPLAGGAAVDYVEGSAATFDDSASGSSPITVTLAGNHSPSGLTDAASKTYVLAGGFSLAGNGALTESGAGTLVLDNAAGNNFGAITISSGTIQLGNNDTGGSLGSAVVTDNGTLALSRTDNLTLGNVISGTGGLAQNGGGNVTLAGVNTFSGITAVNNGPLTVGNTAALQDSTVSNNVVDGLNFASGITSATFGNLAGAGDIALVNADSTTVALTVGGNSQSAVYSGALSDGNLLKAGTNTLVLTGTSTPANIQVTGAGTLVLSNANIATSGLQLVTDNATLVINGGNISAAGDSRIAGANGAYSIGGAAYVSLPKLVIGSASAENTNNQITVSGTAQVYQNQPGGTSPTDALWIGGNNNGSGGLLLKDSALWNNSSTAANIVVIGNFGTGQGYLTIQDSASFYNASTIRVADQPGNVGTVSLNGGTCSANGFSDGAGLGIIYANGGQINALMANPNFFAGFTNSTGTNAVNLLSGGLAFDNGGFAAGITNVLSGPGGLIAQDGGTLTLSASNTYTGGTVVSSGSLILTNAGCINSSASVTIDSGATLDVSGANTQPATGGALTFNGGTLIANVASTELSVGTLGTSGSGNMINLTALPAIGPVPATVHLIKYNTAAPGLVDSGNNLTSLQVTLPSLGSPVGYLTNNAAAKSIDLVITDMVQIPVIAAQPAPDSAYNGGKAHFSVAVEITNSPGLHYQWRKAGVALTDGTKISGSTASTVHLSNIALGDAGSYDVVVVNNTGSVTSNPALLTYLTPTNYEAAAVAAGPVAIYMLQETGDPSTNTPAFDFEGDLDGYYGITAQNGFDGIVGPRPTDGYPGFDANTAAARFFGYTSNSAVTIPPLNLNTNTVTFAAWINPGSPAGSAGLVFCRSGSTVAGFNFTGSTDINGYRTLGYTWNNDGSTYNWNSQIAPPPGIWSYVALVITPTNATVYIINTNNGLLSAVNTYTNVFQSFSGNSSIGEDPINTDNREFDGSMYGVAIYPTALSQRQLANIYGATAGVSNFPPVLISQPASADLYQHQTAAFSAAASGTAPLAYQWMSFDGVSAYAGIGNSSRISGANSASLTISNLALSDATNLVLVVTNLYGSVTSSVVNLTVNPPLGPATDITTAVAQAAGGDWDVDGTWSLPGSATALSGEYYGSTFIILPTGGLRTPNFGNPGTPTTAAFPGLELDVEGNGTLDTSFTVAGGIRIKGGNPATVNFPKLVMNGGQICNILNSGWPAILTGEIDVNSNTVIWASDDTSPRSITIDALLAGNGSITYDAYIDYTNLQTSSGASLNIANAGNPYQGTWNVPLGALVGSAPNALGTNTITVGAQGALQTTYDINNPAGTLVLNGRLYLTQNDTFQAVAIDGTNLPSGTYSYAALAAAYPANFPSTWTPLNGASTATTPAGSITVIGTTPPAPIPLTFTLAGKSLTLGWANLGWIVQSNSVSLLNSNAWFDVPDSQSSTQWNITVNRAEPSVYYRLRRTN